MPFSKFLESLNIVDPKRLHISKDVRLNRLKVQLDGKVFDNVLPRLPMPLSKPEFVILAQRAGDGSWNELCMIKDYRLLDDESRRVLEELLEKNYFIPEIVRVERLETSGDEFRWEVITSKGPRSFLTQGRRSIIVLGFKIIVIDKDDNIYQITDYRKIDAKSRRHLNKFI
ncbi:DUF1854 domain-containing protein [Candidatus Bathyarchaeota archaeon]|nr:DUF1854 domain-containing protein [Candidatus Bathyarchaeota archaeon]MBS7628255.1 DUF1854 domain-containing protein [Candidatus Bathyarchaeota archaeon]